MKFKVFGAITCVCGMLLFSTVTNASDTESESVKQPLAYFPENLHEFSPVLEGVEVTHDFSIQNQGTLPLVVEKVHTS
jgi:hypothetical protein